MINTQTPFLALLGEICWLSVGGGVGPRTFITRSLAMSWEAKARFLGLSWETVSRTSSRKFLRVESCYPESFGFLCLCTMACYFIIFSFLLKWPPSLFSALPFPTHTTQKCLMNFLRCLGPIGLVHFANIMLVHIISGSNYWCKRNGKSDSVVRKWTMSANSFAPQ